MSGVDKSASAMLTHGRAGKARYSPDTNDMFENLDAADSFQSWETVHKMAGPNRNSTVNMNVDFNRGHNGWESSTSWTMKNQFQVDGMTFEGSYNHGTGKLTGYVDWGTSSLVPNVHWFTGLDHSMNNSNFNSVTGCSYVGENWGGVGELHYD